MSAQWKPGDVAIVTRLGERLPAIRREDGWWATRYGLALFDDDPSTSRAVVIELPDGAKGGWHVLVDALRQAREATGFRMTLGGLIEQIEAQTTPPKPDEPTGLGAVVVDEHGVKWVRAGCSYTDPNWRVAGGDAWVRFDAIKAVEVLSEGVIV